MKQHTPALTHGLVQGLVYESFGVGVGVCYFDHFSRNDGNNIPLTPPQMARKSEPCMWPCVGVGV